MNLIFLVVNQETNPLDFSLFFPFCRKNTIEKELKRKREYYFKFFCTWRVSCRIEMMENTRSPKKQMGMM
jgi:hypothetical protein